MIAWFSWLAFADEPVGVELPALVPEEARILPMSGAELVDEAWRRIDLRDYEGARIVAEQARSRGDEASVRATVALGAAWELDGDPARALPLYAEARAAGIDGELAEHVTFRVAECHSALGQYAEAFAELEKLGDPDTRPYLDAKKLHLLRGTWLLESGEREAGQVELAAALSGIGADELTWYQARARAAVATDLCDQANAVPFPEKDKKLVKALKARTELILAAEAQVVAALDLKEPEWGLQGLLVLGLAYEHVADDLLAVPVPKKLKTDAQRGLYVEGVRAKVDALYVKSSRYLGEGIDAATRLSWESPRVAKLQEAHAAVLAKVAPVALPTP